MRLLANLLVAVALCGLPAAGQPPDKVKVGVFPVSSSLPYFIARDLGYFTELNIDPETITLMGGPPNVAALITGQIEVSVVLVTLEGLNANLKKPGVAMYVAMNGQNASHRMEQFVVRSGLADKVTSLKDFKGLKLMSAPGPANLNTAKGILAKVGLHDGDYTIDQLDMGQHINAMKAGTFDGGYTLEPNATVMNQLGYAKTVEAGVIAKYVLGDPEADPFAAGCAFSSDFINKRPDVAKRFAQAWAKALVLIKNDPQEARKHLLKNTLTPENVVDSIPMLGYVMVKDMSAKADRRPADIRRFRSRHRRRAGKGRRAKIPPSVLISVPQALAPAAAVAPPPLPSETTKRPHVTIRGLSKRFDSTVIYDNFDLDIPRGELISVFGPNGCGKSTLINMIAGLVPADAGQILFDGRRLAAIKFGYVFQNYREALFPWLRAFDNIAYPLKLMNVPRAERRARTEKLVAHLGIKLDLALYPYQMSGGQQQLVSILRALVVEPEILFLDEPFSALDYEMTLFMRAQLQRIFLETGTTTILVSHDLEEAVFLADRVLLLSRHPARVAAFMPVAAARPRTDATLSEPDFVRTKAECLDIFQREVRRA